MRKSKLCCAVSIISIVLLSSLVYAQTQKGELKLNSDIESSIRPGEKHRYQVKLKKNKFAFFKLYQKGVDVLLTTYSPNGEKVADFDSPNGTQGAEFASIVSETDGTYILEIRALGNTGPQGKYSLKIASIEPAAKTESAKVDQIFKPWENTDTPGAAVAVVKDGKIAYSKGYGMANLEYDIPIKPNTVFHIASVSKQFTTFSILLLESDGKLSLDDDLRKHIPELPSFGKKITLRHLAHHTSGIRDQWNLLALAGWRLDDVITTEQILKLLYKQKELNFDPGAQYTYSNSGYTLLAEVVARVSGKSFAEFTKERIFVPLGMKNTLFYDDHEKIVKNRAYSYSPSGNSFKKSVLSYANVGATSLFTTVEDLSRWAVNFENVKVGNTVIFEKMKTRGILNNGRKINYALGQGVGKYRGLNRISHSGGDAGYRTYLGRFPDQKFSVIVFSNDGAFSAGRIAQRVANIYLKDAFIDKPKVEKVKKPPIKPNSSAVKIASKVLDSYVGEFKLSPAFSIRIRKRSNTLYGQGTGQGQLKLIPLASDKFKVEDVAAEISFHKDSNGKVSLLKLHQGGRIQDGKRVKPFNLKAVNLKEFTGDFYSDELETKYSLVVENGKLVAKHMRHSNFTLRPLAQDRFRVSAWFVRNVVFERNGQGDISEMKVSTDRVKNVRFKKINK